MNYSSNADSGNEDFAFQLFVAGEERHSDEAKHNLIQICESHIKGRYEIQVVDVFKSFDLALENSIFLTPALIRISPRPQITIYGTLSDTEKVLKAVGIERNRQ